MISAFKFAYADLACLAYTHSPLQTVHLDLTFGGCQVGDTG